MPIAYCHTSPYVDVQVDHLSANGVETPSETACATPRTVRGVVDSRCSGAPDGSWESATEARAVPEGGFAPSRARRRGAQACSGVSIALIGRSSDLRIGLADASLLVLAAKAGPTRLRTLDERHFRAVRPLRGRAFTLLPADAA